MPEKLSNQPSPCQPSWFPPTVSPQTQFEIAAMLKDMKPELAKPLICKDCDFFDLEFIDGEVVHLCYNEQMKKVNLVTGISIWKTCQDAREAGQLCGPTGLLFSPKVKANDQN
jgi:hypothetical protein